LTALPLKRNTEIEDKSPTAINAGMVRVIAG
jgi:hypothetical protein